MADNARYSIYDEKGDIVMVFVGKDNIIENSMKFGRLTQSTHNEMMIVVGSEGLALSQWNFSLGFKFFIRPKWMLVKHLS